MTVADLSQISGKHGLNLKAEREITRRYVDDLCIKITRQTQPISSLRGGNQQKVILGRWFHRNPQVLVLEEPTHGIDVNAKNEVYNLNMWAGMCMRASQTRCMRNFAPCWSVWWSFGLTRCPRCSTRWGQLMRFAAATIGLKTSGAEG